MLEHIEMVRKNSVSYKKDGNSLFSKVDSFYPVEEILKNEAYKGLYMKNIENNFWGFYLEINNVLYNIIERIVYKEEDIEQNIKAKEIVLNSEYVHSTYKSREKGQYFNLLDLEIIKAFKDEELFNFAKESREIFLKNREIQEINAEKERKEKEKEIQEKKNAERNQKLNELENNIKNDKDIDIEKIEGKASILYLFDKYNINVPIKVKGWINQKLVKVYSDGRFSYRKSCSESFWKYYSELKEAVKIS